MGIKMKYKLSTRKINESDLGVECPFMPEEGDYEMYFNALVEEIKNMDMTLNVSHSSDSIIIEIKNESDFQRLHSNVKDFLSGEPFCKLRTSGFEALD